MLKPGIVFIGQPNLHLHELLSLALYLDAPIALSEPSSYEICKKFSSLIQIYKLSKEFSFNFFTSGLTELFTNLQPSELTAFFQAQMMPQQLKVFHLIENGLKFFNAPKNSLFCSSLAHTKERVPEDCEWINLGPVGPLSYHKHKKALNQILAPFLSSSEISRFSMSQILLDTADIRISSEDTLDQIQFVDMAFTGFNEDSKSSTIPAHGLVDACLENTKAGIIYVDEVIVSSLFHRKPFLTSVPLLGAYESLAPLTSILPKDSKNLTPLIENYFDFETINRDELILKNKQKFFGKAYFKP